MSNDQFRELMKGIRGQNNAPEEAAKQVRIVQEVRKVEDEGKERQPRGNKRKEEVMRVQDLKEESSSDDDGGTDSDGEEADKQVRIVHRVRKVDDQGKERQSKWVTIRMGHKRKQIRLFCDTGPNLTIRVLPITSTYKNTTSTGNFLVPWG